MPDTWTGVFSGYRTHFFVSRNVRLLLSEIVIRAKHRRNLGVSRVYAFEISYAKNTTNTVPTSITVLVPALGDPSWRLRSTYYISFPETFIK
jgi:hypothetical protein